MKAAQMKLNKTENTEKNTSQPLAEPKKEDGIIIEEVKED